MAFTNDFGFSFSQHRRFLQCQRRWWLEKVQAWRGWNAGAPDLSRLAYRGKKMTSLFALAGNAVHTAAHQAVGANVPVGKAVARYDSQMRAAWKQAKFEATLDHSDRSKHKTNLFELFYENTGIENLESYAKKAYRRGLDCVEQVYRSTAYAESLEGDLVEAEELHQFDVGGVGVWVKIDHAYDFDGALCLNDWKTGKPNESDRDQMVLYALYAISERNVSLDDLRCRITYLNRCEVMNRCEETELTITQADLDRVREQIVRAATAVREKLDNPKLNAAPASRFPPTQDPGVCRRCELFHACKGHRDVSRPDRIESGFER